MEGEVEDGEEERRGGMEGEGSGLFMDDTEGGGWVRVHREVARRTSRRQRRLQQQPGPRRDRDVNKAMPFWDTLYISLGSAHFSAFTCVSLFPLCLLLHSTLYMYLICMAYAIISIDWSFDTFSRYEAC